MARADMARMDLGVGAAVTAAATAATTQRNAGKGDEDAAAAVLAAIDARLGACIAARTDTRAAEPWDAYGAETSADYEHEHEHEHVYERKYELQLGARETRVPGWQQARRQVRAPAAGMTAVEIDENATVKYRLFNAINDHMQMVRHALFVSKDTGPAGAGAFSVDDLTRRASELHTIEERERFIADAMRLGGAPGAVAGGTLEAATMQDVVAALMTARVHVAQTALNAAHMANTRLRTMLRSAYGARLGEEETRAFEDNNLTDTTMWRAIVDSGELLANYCNLVQLLYNQSREATGRIVVTASNNISQFNGIKGSLYVFGELDTIRLMLRELERVGADVSLAAFDAAALARPGASSRRNPGSVLARRYVPT